MQKKVKTEYTIGEWLDIYLEVYAKPNIAVNTLRIHKDARRRTAIMFPGVEDRPLNDGLSNLEFQKMLNTMAKKYARSTVRDTLQLYRQAFSVAIKNKHCEVNPTGCDDSKMGIHKKGDAFDGRRARAF